MTHFPGWIVFYCPGESSPEDELYIWMKRLHPFPSADKKKLVQKKRRRRKTGRKKLNTNNSFVIAWWDSERFLQKIYEIILEQLDTHTDIFFSFQHNGYTYFFTISKTPIQNFQFKKIPIKIFSLVQKILKWLIEFLYVLDAFSVILKVITRFRKYLR